MVDELDDLVSVFKGVLKSNEKYFEFVTKRLRSAKDNLGVMYYRSLRISKLGCIPDNIRQIIEHENIKGH
jgi:hypothetical protein